MTSLKLVILSAFYVLATGVCAAGPFGFTYGESKAQVIADIGLQNVLKNDKYHLQVSSAPKPHPGFEFYTLVFSPTKGLLKISAVGKNVTTNGFGEQLRSNFNDLEASLNDIYGKPTKYDHLVDGSIWNEPQDWTMAVVKKDRELWSMWEDGEKIQTEHLKAVMLEVDALNRETGYLRLVYEFDGWHDLSQQIKGDRDSVL